jgi:hypothetical protein
VKPSSLFVLLALTSCGGGGGTPGTNAQDSGASDAPTSSDSSPPQDAGGGFATAAWVGDWSCTSSGTLNGSKLPTTASTAKITVSGTSQLSVVSTSTSGNPPCALTATLTSDSQAALASGQSCDLVSPVSATLTLTDKSTATLGAAGLSTVENIVVSKSPGFDGQTGTLTSVCTKI